MFITPYAPPKLYFIKHYGSVKVSCTDHFNFISVTTRIFNILTQFFLRSEMSSKIHLNYNGFNETDQNYIMLFYTYKSKALKLNY